MDTKDLLKEIAKNPDISIDQAQTMLEGLADEIAKVGTTGDSIVIPGFGTFEPRKRDERIVTMPDGRRMMLSPKVTLSFKPSALLKQKIK